MVFGHSKETPAHEQPPEPYAGIGPDGRPVSTGPHNLVIGGTGSGKSRRVLAPSILRWGGPVLSVSSKPDIAELTIRDRARRGPVYLLDLTGQVRDSELHGVDVTHVSSDPCVLIEDDDDALKMAGLLMSVGTLGAGDGTGGGGGDSGFWQTLAVAPLATLLRAGGMLPDPADEEGKQVFGGGIDWVLRASIHTDSEEDDPDDPDDDDIYTPNWDTAILRAGTMLGSRHADHLAAAKKLDPKQRDSIGINARVALAPWMMQTVLGGEDAVPFHPEMLHHPGATLYVVAPGDGAAAGAAVAVVETVIRHWRTNIGKIPRVLLSVDELTNVMPLPGLIGYVTEGRGLGLNVQVALQISDQFELRWGSVGMNVLRKVFPSSLILIGAPEKDMLELAAWQEGEGERQTSSVDASGKKSHSAQAAQTVQGADLLPRHRGEGRLLLVTKKGVKVQLPDISNTGLRSEDC